MSTKIDQLRHQVAAIGQRQADYWRFFPEFAERLEKELGEFLGDPSSVALSCAHGPFSFDHGSYRAEGLGFEGGRFLIPLMVRLKNLKDEGEALVRVRVYFTMNDGSITALIGGTAPVTFASDRIAPLLEGIFTYLSESLSSEAWFAQNSSDYQRTNVGFVAS